MAKFATHMSDPHGDPQTSPQHADPRGLGAIQEIHVDRRVVGWSTGRHVDHPWGWQISPWPARKVTNQSGKGTLWTNTVRTETFRELWASLVHTNFGGNSKGPIIVRTLSWGNSYGPMVLKVLLKFPPTLPVSPYPLNLGVTISPPKFTGWPPENTAKQSASDTPPPKFRGWNGTLQV